MENINSEVSEKVKSAIKAKLMELGAYVDDELPDYIMILVGNKKTKDQMDDDLSLFLGRNTERFTSWLHVVLQKLNAASMLTTTKYEKEQKITPKAVVEISDKKKHKKKKDKSEKKKEKKEKKKKKEKHSKRKREIEDGIKILSKDEVESTTQRSLSSSVTESPKPNKIDEEDDLAEDVVDLRPGADDYALDIEEEMPTKKKKVVAINTDEEMTDSKPLPLGLVFQDVKIKKKSPFHVQSKEETTNSQSLPLGLVFQDIKSKKKSVESDEEVSKPLSLVFQVTNDRVKRKLSKSPSLSPENESVDSVHDRLRPTVSKSSKRMINLREESSFPPTNASSKENGIMNRVVSTAIVSAVRSVTAKANDDQLKPTKMLETRIHPVISTRLKEDKEEIASTRLVSTVAAVHNRPQSSDEDLSDDSDGSNLKKLSGIASKVEIPRSRRVKASHANSALILRAVADAHKSVTKPSKRSLEEKEDAHPIEKKQKIFTRSYQERKDKRLIADDERSARKLAITVPNTRGLKDSVHRRLGTTKSSRSDGEFEEYLDTIEAVEEGPEKPPHLKLQAANNIPKNGNDLNTCFIITMDGAGNDDTDLRSRLTGKSAVRTPSVEDEEEEELIEEVEEWEEIEEVEEVPVQVNEASSETVIYGSKLKLIKHKPAQKKEELCVFWPSCKEGDTCTFMHPSKVNKPCTTFPNCRYANKCMYMHPKCKFDATCNKLNCPFSHSSPKHTPITTTAAISTKTKFGTASAPKCRYYPKCTDPNCPFTHPSKNVLQICHYGAMCHTANCQFVHPELPSNTSLKWTAPKQGSGAKPNVPVDVLTSLSKKIQDLNSLVKKTEKAQVNEELLKLKKMTAILESATT